ncbi:hypothetical protein B0H21DRAFT_424221 [Amylocystis lapponica]|nr:hypothetical protein B0H21DRAFT_424221 [Amylocystis lapponica]
MYYAPRVKRLLFRPQITETSLFASTLSATTYTALGLGSPYPNILPNLVELDWSGSPDIFACGKVMVGPKLKALTLRSVHPASSRKATGTVTLLQHLHTLAPHNLHSLSLYFPSGVNDLPKEAEALRPFHNLRSLTIQTRGPTFDPDLLSQVASLPYLKCLTLDATYRYTQHQTFIDSVHVFPTLTTISCLNGMIRDCETMFRRIRLPAIQHINISAAFVDGLTVLPDILKNCSHTSLRTLRIESGELFPRAVPPSSIASLYSFHAMQELIIHTDTPLILSDSALEDMARAWPTCAYWTSSAISTQPATTSSRRTTHRCRPSRSPASLRSRTTVRSCTRCVCRWAIRACPRSRTARAGRRSRRREHDDAGRGPGGRCA